MSLVVRLLRWARAHAYVGDVAGTLCLILVFAFAWNATFIQYGLLFFWPETACRWWERGRAAAIRVAFRASALGQHHPLAMDIAMALMLVIGMVFVDSNAMLWGREYAPPSLWAILGPCLMVLPLAVRRTMPQTSAALVAAGAFVEILVFPTIGFESVAAIIASFSVSLYAPRRALRRVVPVIAADGLLLAVRAYGESLGYTTLLDLVTGNVTRNVSQGAVEPYRAAVVMGGIALLLCYAAVLRGRWHRIGDRNAYVLQERERELLRTQQQHRVQAANEERNRIASGLQQEVTDTLLHVRQRARDGLTMIETVGQGATGEPIRQAFQSIADQGRQALARMRELLRVLRQTGLTGQVSDEQRARMTAPLQPVRAQGERQEMQ
ncbi:DUF7134 domain-containing protein [Bifidobacterium magnum]|nr:hypothetical protein [Bifidobacterium magnum]